MAGRLHGANPLGRAQVAEAKHWIAGAIKHPGALKATAKRMGLLKGDGKITQTILGKISAKSDDPTTKKRVALARTLLSMHGH